MNLKSMPPTPSGVSSLSNAPQSRIAPIHIHGEKQAELERLANITSRLPGCEIKTLKDDYLHVVCKRFLIFVDDMEFLWNEAGQVFHVRSAARLSITDFGANRTRVELARHLFDKSILF